jgi:hypothetical protein
MFRRLLMCVSGVLFPKRSPILLNPFLFGVIRLVSEFQKTAACSCNRNSGAYQGPRSAAARDEITHPLLSPHLPTSAAARDPERRRLTAKGGQSHLRSPDRYTLLLSCSKSEEATCIIAGRVSCVYDVGAYTFGPT